MRELIVAAIALSLAVQPGSGQADATSRSWNQPVAPFRMIGNIHYVGASGVTSFLITGDQGHVVIDGGFVETAPQILANIRKLGFRPQDVKVLLNTHAHNDHAGGLAELRRATGARLFASRSDGEQIERGGKGDFRFGDSMQFPPATVDHWLGAGESIRLGSVTLTAHATPGHTRGCTSFTIQVQEAGKPYAVVFFCSMSTLDYRFRAPESYPGIAADFTRTFARLRELRCDVFLAPHAAFFDLDAKRSRMANSKQNPFIDPAGCKRYLNSSEQTFRARLKRPR